jgi:ribulose-5-phosphate 4-epimerase/fuculose-1-phosphate aldolase/3-polyprenyl-4-hydroxybenzoate decarboxylase
MEGKVIYVIVSAAAKIRLLKQLLEGLTETGARVIVVATPNAYVALNELKLIESKSISIEKERTLKIHAKNSDTAQPSADAVIVAPASFNTVSKIALGIADNYALTIIATSISKNIPVILAPSYDTLWNHPLNNAYLETLKGWGVNVILPDFEQGHITMAPAQKIVDSFRARFIKVKFNATKLKYTKTLQSTLERARNHYIDEFSRIGIQCEKDGINSGVNGCLSIRWEDWILITTTGSHLSSLKPEDLSLVPIIRSFKNKAIYWYGDKMPSSETPLHLSLYGELSTIKAVAHTHCSAITYNPDYSTIKTENYIPYGEFENSKDLIDLIKTNGFGIMRLHGEVAAALSMDEAYDKIRSYVPILDRSKSD